jgi:hypothetical protein
MNRRFSTQPYPREVADRLCLAAARAREQILDKHVASALVLVTEGSPEIPVDRLLGAYGRLQGLENATHHQVAERVLAALGDELDTRPTQLELIAPRSPWRRLVRRLRGRVHHEFREWLERHSARVHLELIDLHVRHALEFIRITDGHSSPARAIASYCDQLRLRPATAEIVRLMALRSLDTQHRTGQAGTVRAGGPTPLRIADGGS